MNQDIVAFLNKASESAELGVKVRAVMDLEELVRLAKDEGFPLEASAWIEASSALSDEELEGLAGGVFDARTTSEEAGKAEQKRHREMLKNFFAFHMPGQVLD